MNSNIDPKSPLTEAQKQAIASATPGGITHTSGIKVTPEVHNPASINKYINVYGTIVEVNSHTNMITIAGMSWFKVDGNVSHQLTSSFAPTGSNINTASAQAAFDKLAPAVAALATHPVPSQHAPVISKPVVKPPTTSVADHPPSSNK